MIPDDRLKELLTVGGANSAPMHEISEMAEEIITVRSQKKALIEDGERINNRLMKLNNERFIADHIIDKFTLEVLQQHTALMQEIKEAE